MSKSGIFLKTTLLGIILLGYNTTLFAQDEEVFKAKKNSFKFSPTAFFASTFALSYERYLSQSLSMQLTGGIMAASKDAFSNEYSYYNAGSNTTVYLDNVKNNAAGGLVDFSFRFFFLKSKSVMSGLYAGPYGRYCKNKFEITQMSKIGLIQPVEYKYQIESYEGGVLFGWQWVAGNAFVMDIYVGGGLKISQNTAPASYDSNDRGFLILESQDYTGITPKGGLRVGFVF
jgi:hypothetical protein